jgi:hypothetical protein
MSLLSSFIQNQLIKALESEFVTHSADIQEAFVGEVELFANEVLSWVKNKVEPTPPTAE